MARRDVAVVGEVGGLMCSLFFMFPNNISNVYNRLLAPATTSSRILYTDLSNLLITVGKFANGIFSIPDELSFLYCIPTLETVNDNCNNIDVSIALYFDTDGINLAGYLEAYQTTDGAGNPTTQLHINNNKKTVTLAAHDVCQTTTTDIVASCRYSLDLTKYNNLVSQTYLNPACTILSNGLCALETTATLEFPETYNTNLSDFFLVFTPLTYYTGNDCTIVNTFEGFIPSPLAYTQCSIYPQSEFGALSSTCLGVTRGFSKPQYCGSDIFSYGYSGSECGQTVSYYNLLGIQVKGYGSGLCSTGTCVGNITYSCQDDSSDASNGDSSGDNSGDNSGDASNWILWAIVGVVMLIVVIVVVLLAVKYFT